MKTFRLANGDRAEDRRSNGIGKLQWWIMSGFAGLVTTGALMWVSAIQASVNGKIDAEMVTTKFALYDEIVLSRGERLTRLETNYVSIASQLSRIDRKMDELLGRRGH